MFRGNPLVELDELIGQAEEAQDYCSETGPNEAMKRAAALREIRESVSELLMAGQRVSAAFRANGSRSNGGFDPRTHQECEAAVVSLDRLVARIGGAA